MRLDVAQRAAAAAAGSPVRVLAGPGTGKTAVITERYRRLVAGGVPANRILVMTFTERAAAEMRQRIEHAIGAPAPAVGTFHSIALGWLREDFRLAGVPAGFQILAGAERWILTRELMWRIGDVALTGDERPDDLVAPALQVLERLKQELVPLEQLDRWARHAEDRERAELMRACVRLFRAYARECRAQRLLDFDDLLLLTVRMLERHPALRERYGERFPHLLVDEYQDLNLAQERLVELVAADREPFVVGDDDQSIYRFRGASRASLERFLGSFPAAGTVTLARNRRSSRRIVAAASALIGHNTGRIGKAASSDLAGPSVELWRCDDGESEAAAIAAEAARLIASGAPASGIAVLCRTNAIGRPIASALAARGIPHVVVGASGFHDRPEIKDLIAMLRTVLDPADAIAMARVRSREATGGLEPLLDTFAAAAKTTDVRDVFFELMEQTRYLDRLRSALAGAEAARATANAVHFGESMAEYCERSPDHSLAAFLRHLELVIASGEDEEPPALEQQDGVQVMTIHQAKGLEFDAVFVPCLVEGRLPQPGRSPRFELPPAVLEPLVRGREDVIAEERRLLYVAMTRARRSLFLTCAAHYEGGRRWRESRFLGEVREAGARVVKERRIVAAAPAAAAVAAAVEGNGPVQLSFSAITAYRDCPRQYWYRYVEKLPAAQSAEAVHGVILHETLRRAAEMRREGKKVGRAALREIHDAVWSSTPFPDARRAPTFRRIGAAELEAYRLAGGLDRAPELVEHAFATAVDGWTLRGVIDRVDRTDSGWRIVDYKSGRPVARRNRDLQVALYGLGATSALALSPVELEVVYLASGKAVQIADTDRLLADAVAEGSAVAAGVRAGRFEPRPDRRRCRLCPYRLACADAV